MAKVINSNAAGIDIASNVHYVCVPNPNPKEEYGIVKSFGSFTRDLHDIVSWIKEHKVSTVAMESTGIYWTELFFVLKESGLDVILVDARHIKNVTGRKTDIKDAQWIQKLHSYGFLRGCYQPENVMRTLRTYTRRRSEIIRDMSKSTNRQLKALEQMNLKTKQIITDIHGKTGQAIINAILNGEREAKKFLAFKHPRIKACDEDFVLALEGNWKAEQLYLLEIENNTYHFFEKELRKLDIKIEETLQQLTGEEIINTTKGSKPKSKNSPMFNAQEYLKSLLGVDVTNIYGIKENAALKIVSETGIDLKRKFPSEKQFLSWLNLVPNNKISGGKILSSKMKKKKNIAGQTFREASSTLWRSKNPLGEQLRSKKAQKGAGPAIVSIARRLAIIYYNIVTKKKEFEPEKLKKNRKKAIINKISYYERKVLEMREKYEMELI